MAGLDGLAACYWMFFSSIREQGLVCQTATVNAYVEVGSFTFVQKLFDKIPHKL